MLLQLANGITTVREVGAENEQRSVRMRDQQARGELVGPRLLIYPMFGGARIRTAADARERVQQMKKLGVDGIKITGLDRDIMAAMQDEAKKLSLPVAHHVGVEETTAWDDIAMGTRSIEHWYGVPDAALTGSQHFPGDYNYWDELDRFRWAGRLWAEADRHPARLDAVIHLMVQRRMNWNPTMATYEDNRDVWRNKGLPVRETLMHPSEVVAGPDSSIHGAFKRDFLHKLKQLTLAHHCICKVKPVEFNLAGSVIICFKLINEPVI